MLYCSVQGLGCRKVGRKLGVRRPNKSFKPKPLRYAKHMASKACHVFRSTTRLGLTLALGIMERLPMDRSIQPHKVTKPIQLLAAWMVGLVVTNATFLTAATYISSPGWERGALVIASIANVPLFIVALFVLQTKFRAELQEDHFYAEYLSKKTSSIVRMDKNAVQDSRLVALEREIVRIGSPLGENGGPTDGPSRLDWSKWPVALNQLHPRFDEVREALRDAGIPLTEIFGNIDDTPSRWVISLSNGLPTSHKVAILRALMPFQFDGFSFWDPVREAEETEDVYIGSYGNRSFATIDDSLERLLEKNVEEVDLRHYYSRHKAIPLVKSGDA